MQFVVGFESCLFLGEEIEPARRGFLGNCIPEAFSQDREAILFSFPVILCSCC